MLFSKFLPYHQNHDSSLTRVPTDDQGVRGSNPPSAMLLKKYLPHPVSPWYKKALKKLAIVLRAPLIIGKKAYLSFQPQVKMGFLGRKSTNNLFYDSILP